MERRWKLLVLSVLALLGLMAAAATIHKWVDERGVTHYSTTPPPGGKSVEINTADPPPAPAVGTSSPTQKSTQEILDEYRRDRAKREEAQRRAEEAAAKARAALVARKQRCIIARQNAYALEQSRPVFTLNERGERVYLDDENRAAELERLRREIRQFCDP